MSRIFSVSRLLLAILLLTSCQKGKWNANSHTAIVGGRTPGDESPALHSTVALVKKDGKRFSTVCSGILVAPRLVLTAAHCVESTKTTLSVLFSMADTDADPQTVAIDKSLTFKKDGSRFFPNFDIAWVRLKEDAPRPWKPVELLRSSQALRGIEGKDQSILLAGYGRTASVCLNSECMGRLYEVRTRLEHFFNEAHFSNLLVIGPNPGHGTCNGDSGGPAFIKLGNRWLLAGILNGKSPLLNSPNLWQDGVCESGEAIYNYSGAYIEWIERTSGVDLNFDDGLNPPQAEPTLLANIEDLGPHPTLEQLLTFNNHEENLWASVETLVANFKNPANRFGATVEELVTQPFLAANAMRRWTELRHVGISYDFVISTQKSNQLVDVRAIGELSGLKSLILDSNKILDTAPLGKLTELETLGLRNNYDYRKKLKVSWNLNFIAHLSQLKKLDLSNNSENLRLSAIDWDRLPNLETLELSDNRGLDLNGVPWELLPRLKTLIIRNSTLHNIDALSKARSLEHLDLSRNDIDSVEPLASLNQLGYLDVSMNAIDDFTPLAALTQLKSLKALSNIQATDFCPSSATCVFSPANFTDFESYCRFAFSLSTEDLTAWSGGATVMRLIQIAGVQAQRLEGCHDAQIKLSKMRSIDLSGSPIAPRLEDLSPLAPLTGLETLNLANNELRSIKALAGLTKLRYLDLSQNYIDDVTPLQALQNLETLDVDGNFLQTLAPLSAMPGLVVFARGNPIVYPECPIPFGTCHYDEELSL